MTARIPILFLSFAQWKGAFVGLHALAKRLQRV